jgi:hypothetical protein
MCRKHHGTLFSSSIGAEHGRLEWLSGLDDIVHYRASPRFERPFCGQCGSTVPAVSHDERYWNVPAGLLAGDFGARPRSHIFVASKSPLYELRDALPKHAAYPYSIGLPALERSADESAQGELIGSCLCNAVAFALASAPRRVVSCYCSLCRRRSGGAFTSTLLAAPGLFRWLRGHERVRHYALPPPRQYAVDFCADCGSPVPNTATGTVLVPAGSIDSALPPLPHVHLYVGSIAPWYTITDDWPQFDELPPAERFRDFFQ